MTTSKQEAVVFIGQLEKNAAHLVGRMHHVLCALPSNFARMERQ